MFVLRAEYRLIIQKCLEVSDGHLIKDVQYDPLECRTRIAQTKQHPIIGVHPIFYEKCRLQLILLYD